LTVLSRFTPLAIVVLFVAVCIALRSWVQLRRHGAAAFALRPSRSRTDLGQTLLLAAFAVVWLGEAIVAAYAPELMFLVLRGPAADIARPVGTAVAAVAILAMFAAQVDLGASWRIGIEPEARPGLVTTGWYSFCRNPIYLFWLLVLAGFALVVPTAGALALFVGAFLGARRTVFLEEAYLTTTYGREFLEYASKVGRFLPRIGRLTAGTPVASRTRSS
jgi:protein-S-isoprenylcysteine O-methyltransferase Ste14